jgi:hypothetical protein
MKRLKYIIIPKILWYISGMFIWDNLYSYYWLNIKKRKVIWGDAEECDRVWCRYCGKGKSFNS